MHARKGRRWYRRMLAVVDPSELADSVESYLNALPPEEVRTLALSSAKAMPPPELAQFGLYVDRDSLEKGADGLLARRFTAFLRQNPRAIESLGRGALDRILAPFELYREATPARPRVALQTVALIVLALIVAFVPLAAQYAHQRGLLDGLTDTLPAAVPAVFLHPAAPPALLANAPRHAPPRRAVPAHPQVHHARARSAPAGSRIAFAPRPRVKHRVSSERASPAPVRSIASVWKFDRRDYRYFNHRGAFFQQRARLEVQSYLNDVIAGKTQAALQHLGLPPDADLVNLSEVPIVSPGARAHVVVVKPRADGRTQVEADIKGRKGEYYEVFYVAADGPAVRITDHYYIPVNK